MFASFDYAGNLKLFVSVCVGILIMTFITAHIARSKLCCGTKGTELLRAGSVGLRVPEPFQSRNDF